MSSNKTLSNDLFLKLKSRFPTISLRDRMGESTDDPSLAVIFKFDFMVASEKVATVNISTAEKGSLMIFFSKDTLTQQNDIIKGEWFDFLRGMRTFAKKKLLNFKPKDITKQNLDKRDYNFIAKKNKDQNMNESSLYGSTKSSYQKLENTKLIIRHSKKIEETGINNRTRNIESVFIESADGERFKYPFIHLSGARAMQRHVANGGNPYDNFGQYIVGLSEQVYNLRRFNHLVNRNAFLENLEITSIADAAKEKGKAIKKTLESIQKQRGYEIVQENFISYERKVLSPEVLENLKNRFTVQQFNEELVELFPYITDLLGEEEVKEAAEFVKGAPGKGQGKPTGDYDDSDAASEPIGSTFGKFKDKPRDESYDLMMVLQATPVVKMEPFDKASIQKAIDGTQHQIRELEKAAKENPRDKQTQYGLEKASARLGLLQARAGTAEPKATNNVTKNALTIEHLATHVKDDRISLLLSRISEDYPKMAKDEQREVNNLIRLMMSKVKIVPMFTNENTTFEEIENLLVTKESNNQQYDEKLDYVSEYARLLDNIVGEKSDLLSGDPDIQGAALTNLNKLMPRHFPAGINGDNAIDSLKGIIDDPELSYKLRELGKTNSDECVRPTIMQWIDKHASHVKDKIDIGDMAEAVPGTLVPPSADARQQAQAVLQKDADQAVVGRAKMGITDVDEELSPSKIEEFVKSLYDKNTGHFPLGETGVLAKVEKKFGHNAAKTASSVIEQLKHNFDENLMRMRKLAGVS